MNMLNYRVPTTVLSMIASPADETTMYDSLSYIIVSSAGNGLTMV